MYTLRLILKGVIFLTMAKGSMGQNQLWLLLLDPGYKTAIHHEARLYVDPRFKDASSRSFDGTDSHGNQYFDLSGDHLTFSFPNPQPTSLFFAKGTRPAGKSKPCFDCGSAFTFRQQKDDTQWINSLSEILKDVPLQGGHSLTEAMEARTDIVASDYATDGLILARIALEKGEIRTYTLWGENEDPTNVDLKKISSFAFKKPTFTCDPAMDPNAAVAQIVVIELAVDNAVSLDSRFLPDHTKPGRGSIVLKGTPGTLVEVEISSMRHDQPPRDGDFNAFYEMLKHPDYFLFRPLPAPCKTGDSGGACSPAGR